MKTKKKKDAKKVSLERSSNNTEDNRDSELYLWGLYCDFNPGVSLADYRVFADWIIWSYIHEMHDRYRGRMSDANNLNQGTGEFPEKPSDN